MGRLFVFYANLFLVYFFSLFSRLFVKQGSIALNRVRPNYYMAALALATMVLVAGLQNNIGDTYFYMYSYVSHEFTWLSIIGQKDVGFNIFQMLLQKINRDPQFLIFVVALITNALIVTTLYKYSNLFEISLYVYITSGMFLVSMNGIRQFLAASIFFAASKYLFNGNWIKYILIVLLAAQLHQSALILIPIYFVVRRKAWSWTTTALLTGAIFVVIAYNQFTSVLFTALDNSNYSEYKNSEEGGANILRVLVYFVPILIAFLGRKKLRSLFPQSDYIVNMSLLALVFMIISTQNWIFARFTIYFGLYIPILFSWLIKLFVAKEQKLIYYLILVFYFIYFFYENVIALGMFYHSNYLKF